MIESLSAVTLETSDMARAFAFYAALGFELRYGGPDAAFTSFVAGGSYLNLQSRAGYKASAWGRVIFYVADVDALYSRALRLGYSPSTQPRDAEWGERFFHISDPDGHELSFARLL
jgi:catechol 2,3-dioxygenase-like lactoylglutathione lyase family enzyme